VFPAEGAGLFHEHDTRTRHFRRSYLTANKVSKMKEQGKLNTHWPIIWKCADAVYQKLSKLVHACWNYSWPNLSWRVFLRHGVDYQRSMTRTHTPINDVYFCTFARKVMNCAVTCGHHLRITVCPPIKQEDMYNSSAPGLLTILSKSRPIGNTNINTAWKKVLPIPIPIQFFWKYCNTNTNYFCSIA